MQRRSRLSAVGIAAIGLLLGIASLLSSAPAISAEDQPAATISGADFSFGVPDALPTGSVALTFTNTGAQPHELVLLQLASGYTLNDVLAHLADPQPPSFVTPVGSIDAIDPGTSTTSTFDLTASTYLLVCFIEDTTTRLPHAVLGMVAVVLAQ